MEPVTPKQQQIIDLARECIGTPFGHQGRVVGLLLDCAGVLEHILRSKNLPYIDELGYPRQPCHGMMERILDSQPSLEKIPRTQIEAACVLLMRIKHEPQHIAIFTGHSIIHAYSDIGRVVEQSFGSNRRGIMAAYRILDL